MMPFFATAQTQTENYLKTTTFRGAGATLPQIQVTYVDGLGRPIQKIANNQSRDGKNIISHIEYDGFGRQAREYLPYASASSSSLDYVASTTAMSQLTTYYGTSTASFDATTAFFGDKIFEESPLNRLLMQTAPGDSWTRGSRHEIKMDYLTNSENEVLYFLAEASSVNRDYSINLLQTGSRAYEPGQLYKNVTKNENWIESDGDNNTTQEFKNKMGQVVLKRTFNNDDPHDTYYVYDQYGNLTYVLPPKADSFINAQVIDDLCYQYKYDYRNRLVEKKIPGKQWEFIVYDKLDRVVATGPALSPFEYTTSIAPEGWLITKYDYLNRPVLTGWLEQGHINAAKRKIMQNDHNNETINFNEMKSATASSVNNVVFQYTNNVLPTAGYQVLTINYYDNYNFPNAPAAAIISAPVNGQMPATNVKSLPTGIWERVLKETASSLGESSYTLYDSNGRPIANYKSNFLGGFVSISNTLDFSGKILNTSTLHKYKAVSNVLTVDENFTYTPQDRLLQHTHQINGGPIVVLAHNGYDPLGQLITKNVGGTTATPAVGLQTIDYKYNIRGWLTDINNVNNLASSGTPDLFAFKINYDQPLNQSPSVQVPQLFNGNISETLWRTSSDNNLRQYSYNYDQLNRLGKATYQKPLTNTRNSYNEQLAYDKNGNITELKRNGELDSEVMAIEIDNLQYEYANGDNKLTKVIDGTNNPAGFKDDSDGTNDPQPDYAYDANGNMISDQNKNIVKIKYNHLNLPTEILFGNNNQINYLYTATGVKLQKKVKTNDVVVTTNYVDGFQYKNNALQFFPHAEGYVNCVQDEQLVQKYYNYVFNYVDHLGNIRLSYGVDPSTNVLKIIEENHYYPFGLKHNNYNTDTKTYGFIGVMLKIKPVVGAGAGNKYKFLGQERQDELGLNWDTFRYRNYDYAIGRFMGVDPLAEKYLSISPYAYCLNNPILFSDPDGKEIVIYYKVNGSSRERSMSYTYEKNRSFKKGHDANDSKFLKNAIKMLDKLVSTGATKNLEVSGDKKQNCGDRVLQIVKDSRQLSVVELTGKDKNSSAYSSSSTYLGEGNKAGYGNDNYLGTVKLNDEFGLIINTSSGKNETNSPTAQLGHEILHEEHNKNDEKRYDAERINLMSEKNRGGTPEEKLTTKEANQINSALGEPVRNDYSGINVKMDDPTVNKPTKTK